MCVLNWWINSDITSTFQTSPTSGLKFRSINTSTHGWELLGKLPLVGWTNSIILLDLSLFPSCISLRGPGAGAGEEREDSDSDINRAAACSSHRPLPSASAAAVLTQTHTAWTHRAPDAPLCLPPSHYPSATTLDESLYFTLKPQLVIEPICPVWVSVSSSLKGAAYQASSNIPFGLNILWFHKCADGLAQSRSLVHAFILCGMHFPT